MDPSEFSIWQINAGGVTNNGTWVAFNVDFIDGGGIFTDGDVCFVELYQSGGAGLQGLQGIQGDPGFDGQPGADGIQGIQGILGLQGIQGIQGTGGIGGSGVQGTQGIQGIQGFTGIGAPGLQGAQGIQGIQGILGLPGAGLQGTQGLQGIQGHQGEIGEEGGGGEPGLQGFVGLQGIQGNPGVGSDGIQGPQGTQGIQGFQGPDGTLGQEGLQGPQGTFGQDGETGLQGYTGEGEPGAQGGTGPQGPTGIDGLQVQGPTGEGFQGPNGSPGPEGPEGPFGLQGIQGSGGLPGDPGPIGLPGPDGDQGNAGAQGGQGFQGPQAPGLPGPPGPDGDFGPDGIQGFQGFSALPIELATAGISTRTAAHPGVVYNVSDGQNYFTSSTFGWQDSTGTLEVSNLTIQNAGDLVTTGAGTHSFTGTVDFSGATVSGLPVATGGFIDATNDSIKTAGSIRLNDTVDLKFGTASDINMQYDASGVLQIQSIGADNQIDFMDSASAVRAQILYSTGSVSADRFLPLGSISNDPSSAWIQGANSFGAPVIDFWYIVLGGAAVNSHRFSNAQYYTTGSIEAEDTIRANVKVRVFDGSIEYAYMDDGGDVFANNNFISASDARLKENVITIDNALDKVTQLRGVYYNRIDKADKSRRMGVIAQEVQAVIPEVVHQASFEEGTDGLLSVDYAKMVGILIEAIKDLKAEVDELKRQKGS